MNQNHRLEAINDLAVSESGFIFDPKTGSSFTLNQTAREIFYFLKSGLSEKDIIELLQSRYEIQADLLERDLYDFMLQLKSFRLIDGPGKRAADVN